MPNPLRSLRSLRLSPLVPIREIRVSSSVLIGVHPWCPFVCLVSFVVTPHFLYHGHTKDFCSCG